MRDRVIFLDTSRAISMLWIVAVWHMVNLNRFKPGIEGITIGVLALFTFISGYFLGGELKSNGDIRDFLKKRLKRFYPLFALSCVTLYFLHLLKDSILYIDSLKQLLLTLTGLACFISPMPLTIWYFCMIMFFYFITPIITRREGKREKIVVSVVIYVILIVSCFAIETDIRLITYFPFYVAGLLLHGKKIENKFNIKKFGIVFLLTIPSILLYSLYADLLLVKILVGLVVMIAIMEFSKLFTSKKLCQIIQFISYASMCAYLFHRQYYTIVGTIMRDIPWVVRYIVMIPSLIIFSGVLQKAYDVFVRKIENFRK